MKKTDKGMRSVSINFAGKQRTFKFGHMAIGNFENEANDILRAQNVVKDGMIFADGLIANWLGNTKIFELALRYALRNEPDISEIDIYSAIDKYIEDGGNKQDLVRNLVTAYKYVTDPSSVASLLRSWKISDDRAKFATEAENESMDKMEKIIADAKAKLTLGTQSTGSQSSNSDSPQKN